VLAELKVAFSVAGSRQHEPEGDPYGNGPYESGDQKDFEEKFFAGNLDHALRIGRWKVFVNSRGASSMAHKKEADSRGSRPAWCGVLHIVNWEGNYTLDTNTFIVVTG
jgi:hypothetical protein